MIKQTSEKYKEYSIKFIVSLIFFFGGNLYLSYNKNINDPKTSPLFSIIKDLILLSFFLFSIYLSHKEKKLLYNKSIIIVVSIVIAILFIIPLYISQSFFIDFSYFKILKNFFIYSFLFYFGVNYLFVSFDYGDILKIIADTITWSLVFSIFLHLSKIIPSEDYRMYGTYGNPTSLGLAAIYLYILLIDNRFDLEFYHMFSFKKILAIFIVSLSIFYCGSMSILIMYIAVLPLNIICSWIYLKSEFIRKINFSWFRNFIFYYILLMLMLIFSSFIGHQTINSKLFDKIYCIAYKCNGDILSRSNSLSDRVDIIEKVFSKSTVDYSKIFFGFLNPKYNRSDSSLLSLYMGFGAIVPILVIMIFIYAIMQYTSIHSLNINNSVKSNYVVQNMTFLILVLTLNLPFQHQIEIFPSNVLIFFVLYSGLYLKMKLISRGEAN